MEENIKDYEICQIYAGSAQSFAVTRTGKIFAWGDNSSNMLGLDLNRTISDQGKAIQRDRPKESIRVAVPTELKLQEYNYAFKDNISAENFKEADYSDKNFFKKKSSKN